MRFSFEKLNNDDKWYAKREKNMQIIINIQINLKLSHQLCHQNMLVFYRYHLVKHSEKIYSFPYSSGKR